MAAFYLFTWSRIYNETESDFMGFYRYLKFKMKLAYECFKRSCRLQDVILEAISKTLDEMHVLYIADLQKYLNDGDGSPTYSEYNLSSSKQEIEDRKEHRKEIARHIKLVENGLLCNDLKDYITKKQNE